MFFNFRKNQKVFNKFVSTIEDEQELNADKLIIDSSFKEAPKQRNTFEENAVIKAGNGASLWNDNSQKKCHKDIDARWTKKRDETYYGYKAHASVGATTKLIHMVKATAANVHEWYVENGDTRTLANLQVLQSKLNHPRQ